MENEDSIELTLEEIRSALPALGFKLLKEELSLSSEYTHHPNSMLHMTYNCALWVCQKVGDPPVVSMPLRRNPAGPEGMHASPAPAAASHSASVARGE